MRKLSLPSNMNNKKWTEFFSAFLEEVRETKKNIIEKKKGLYNPEFMRRDRVIEFIQMFDIPYNSSYDNSLDFLREEIRVFPTRVKWKSSILIYKHLLSFVRKEGEFFGLSIKEGELVRDSKSLLLNSENINPLTHYTHESLEDFNKYYRYGKCLDEDDLHLDDSPPWFLDEKLSVKPTNHLALEVVIDRAFYGGKNLAPSIQLAPSLDLAPMGEFLFLDTRYFSYFNTNIEVLKRATEVIHIGCQLTVLADSSKVCNSHEEEYTMPSLQLDALTTDYFNGTTIDDLCSIEFGSGKYVNLPKFDNVGVQPTDLDNKFARIKILESEKYEDDNALGIIAKYNGCFINDIKIGEGDGVNTTFNYSLPNVPIKKGTLKVGYTSANFEHEARDDTFGRFTSQYGSGTINYETGLLEFKTQFTLEHIKTFDGDGVTTEFTDILPLPLKRGSLQIKYILGGTLYVAKDDGVTGSISGVSCSGSIVYNTGDFSIQFSQAPEEDTEVILTYHTETSFPPDIDSKVDVEFFTERPTRITEAGVRDKNGNLIAYTTFPSIVFDNNKNYVNLGFILKKDLF